MNKGTDKKGFTLLFASLIVSLILSVGIAIANITLAQLTLSTAGRESQVALYNADTALECALYYQYKVLVNPNPPDEQSGRAYPYTFFPQSGEETPAPMECGGFPNELIDGVHADMTTGVNPTVTKYTFNVTTCTPDTYDQPSFAIESIKTRKNAGEDNVPFAHYNVTIRTRGYNTCNPTNPRRVERGLYVHNIIEAI